MAYLPLYWKSLKHLAISKKKKKIKRVHVAKFKNKQMEVEVYKNLTPACSSVF